MRSKQAEQKFWHNKTYLVSSEGTLQRWVLELLKWGKGAGISRGDVARGLGQGKGKDAEEAKETSETYLGLLYCLDHGCSCFVFRLRFGSLPSQ